MLYNDGDSNSLVPARTPPNTTDVSFSSAHIPATDTVGNLSGTGSSTYILVRLRATPLHVRKDTRVDANFDGQLDFGAEPGPYYGSVGPVAVQPIQRVDEFAWSNEGGKEYVADSDDEISDTPGFNPDAISRLGYFLTNPMLGHRTRDDGLGGFEIVSTRAADESFIYGEVPFDSLLGGSGGASLEYSTVVDPDGNKETKGPTDPTATPYDGTCDPEPNDPGPNPACLPNPAGSFLFTDVNTDGFALTPGSHNDGAGFHQIRFQCVQAPGALPEGFTGQYWREGDFDMNGVVDCANDVALIESRIGASLDDTFQDTDPFGNPFQNYTWQNGDFQVLCMMLNMDTTDGPGGTNATTVTQADVDATLAAIPPRLCAGDIDGDDDTDVFDFGVFTSNFGDDVPCGTLGDLDLDGDVDVFDFGVFGPDFGCDAD